MTDGGLWLMRARVVLINIYTRTVIKNNMQNKSKRDSNNCLVSKTQNRVLFFFYSERISSLNSIYVAMRYGKKDDRIRNLRFTLLEINTIASISNASGMYKTNNMALFSRVVSSDILLNFFYLY